MTYSTQKNITTRQIKTDIDKVCNRYATYPNNTKEERFLEGGLRLQGKYKQSIDTKPLITVITVVYNNVATLERCIKSILNQSYDNIEYIVIDGGSTDGTLDIIKKYSDAIDYYVSEPDEGIYYAMNKGLELASGDYIAFMNADDLYSFNYAITVSVTYLVYSGARISYADTYLFNEKGFVNQSKGKCFDEYVSLGGEAAKHQTFFVHQKCFNESRFFNTDYFIAADIELYDELLRKNKFVYIPLTLVFFCLDGISGKKLDEMREELSLVKMQAWPKLKGLSMKEVLLLRVFCNGYYDFFERNFSYDQLVNILLGDCLNTYQKLKLYQNLKTREDAKHLLKNFAFIEVESQFAKNIVNISDSFSCRYKDLFENYENIVIKIIKSIQNELVSVQNELNSVQNELNSVQNELVSVQNELARTKKEINIMRQNEENRLNNKLSRKLWVFGKILSKKLKIYPVVKPFAERFKKCINKNK